MLSQQRRDELAKIMSEGNTIARRLFESYQKARIFGRKGYLSFRHYVGRGVQGKLSDKQLAALDEQLAMVDKGEVAAMKAVNEIQNEVLEENIKLCLRFASYENLGEATLILADALYHYTDINIEFSTYATNALLRTINRKTKKQAFWDSVIPASDMHTWVSRHLIRSENSPNRDIAEFVPVEDVAVAREDVEYAKEVFNSLAGLTDVEQDAWYSRHVTGNPLKEVAKKYKRSRQAMCDAVHRAELKIATFIKLQLT